MKKILLSVICLFALKAYGQCIDCDSFEEALKKPETVKSIRINSSLNKITLDYIPGFIGSFINPEVLYLTDHNIRSFPAETGKLTKLKELSLAECKLTGIPDIIFSLKNLKELILFDNPFSDEYKKELKMKLKKELPAAKILL